MANEFRVSGLKFQDSGILKVESATSISLKNAADSDHIDFTAGSVTVEDTLTVVTSPTATSTNDFDLLGRTNTGGTDGDVVRVTLGSSLSINGSGELVATGSGHTIEAEGTPLTDRANLDVFSGLTAEDNNPDTTIRLGGTLAQGTIVDGAAGTYSMTFSGLSTFNAQEQGGNHVLVNGVNALLSNGAGGESVGVSGSSVFMKYDSGALALTFSTSGMSLDLGSDATGDTYYRNASGNYVRLPIGASGQVLTTNGTDPSWDDIEDIIDTSQGISVESQQVVLGTSTLTPSMTGSGINRYLQLGNSSTTTSNKFYIYGAVQNNYFNPSIQFFSETSEVTTRPQIVVNSGSAYLNFRGSRSDNSDPGQVVFFDGRPAGSKWGIEYSADYSVDFTDRSLVDKAYVLVGKTYTDNSRHIFNPGTNAAGINIGQATANPDTPINGDIYYNSTAHEYRAYINSVWVALGTGGGGGSVTSVGLSNVTNFWTVSGSPVTGSGTLSVTLNTQVANQIFAGPTSGSASTPSFRAMVNGDLPNAVFEDVTGTTYTFVSADNKKWKRFTNVAGCIANVPTGLPSGWSTVAYAGDGAGTITITSSGSLESTAATLETPKTSAVIVHRGSDAHVALGALGTSGLGSVTSVAMTVPSIFSLTGSPITSSGTLALSLANQSANEFFAGPTSGGDTTPTFRVIDPLDIPVPTKNVTSTTYTIVSGDRGYRIYFTNVSGCTTTLDDSLVAGFWFHGIRDEGAGTTTFSAGGSAVLNTPGDLFTIDNEHGEVKWSYNGSNNWYGTGDIGVGGGGSGTVTSVGLSSITSFATATGSPVTSSGTLGYTLNTQAANLIFGGPASGANAVPTFRSLVPLDLPRLQKTVSAATYTLLDGDLDYEIYFTSASGCAVTIPNTITVDNLNASLVRSAAMTGGDLTIVASGTTLRSINAELTIAEVNGSVTVSRVGSTTEWYIFGALGEGLSNIAAEDEIPRTNSSGDLIASGTFAASLGNLTLGSASISGDRTVTASSSTTDSSILLTPQASGTVNIVLSGTKYLALNGTTIAQNNTADSAGLNITGAAGSSGAKSGKGIIVQAGSGFNDGSNNTGGSIQMYGGLGRNSAQGGNIEFYSGGGDVSSGSSGLIAFRVGDANLKGEMRLESPSIKVGYRSYSSTVSMFGDGGDSTDNDGVHVQVTGGAAYSSAGDGNGGDVRLLTGLRRTAGTGHDGNVAFFGIPASWQGMGKGIFIANRQAAPSSLPADGIFAYAEDSSDSTSTLALYLEQAVEVIGTFTASHKIKVLINGTEYWLQLDAV